MRTDFGAAPGGYRPCAREAMLAALVQSEVRLLRKRGELSEPDAVKGILEHIQVAIEH